MKKALVSAGLVGVVLAAGAVAWLQAAAPQIDAVSVNPAYIVINTPTTVVFTAKITDPSLQPTGLNLLQTDAGGKTLSTVGVMNDTGTNGDAVAGDKIFSRSVSLNQAGVGQLYYRVSAPFKGVLARTLSPVMTVTVDPVKLPPDPGEAGKQTLEGIDSDEDGVRDDIQRFIIINYPDRTQQNGLTQFVQSLQSLVVEAGQPQRTALHWLAVMDAEECLIDRFGTRDFRVPRELVLARLLNTEARNSAYMTANRYPPPAPDTTDTIPPRFSTCRTY
ncbi:MAG: hypothetical protein IT184_03680 [Acidobacteria bacterium]|nr:hypothetical protein [Acidobacteriota bacterium]